MTYDSVFDAINDSAPEAANMLARAEIMRVLQNSVKEAGWTQANAAQRLGISQPRLNDLLRGKLSKFSLDALVNLAMATGHRVRVELEPAQTTVAPQKNNSSRARGTGSIS